MGISSLQWCLRKSSTLGTNFSNSLCRCSTDCWKNRDEKTVMRLFIIYYTINQIAAKSGVAVSGGRHQRMFTSIIQVTASSAILCCFGEMPFSFFNSSALPLFTAQLVCCSPAHSEDYHGSGIRFGVGRPLGEAPGLPTHQNPIRKRTC